jgi:hypothetical protein
MNIAEEDAFALGKMKIGDISEMPVNFCQTKM